jgi:hypothetical protein
MYDELVKRLRDDDAWKNCDFDFIYVWMHEAADAIEELSRENESLAKSVNEASEILRKRWIPVTERLPEEHVFVLIRQDDDRMMVAERVDGDWWYRYFAYDVDRWDENEQGAITHWMPLPSTEGLNET